MYLIKAFQFGVKAALTVVAALGGILLVVGFLAGSFLCVLSLFR